MSHSRSSLMASSSSRPRTWRYRVFTSFHGPDVRKTFLSHLRKQFSSNGISMFNDQEIERSQTIAPALTQAIRESRISIVVLTKNYASSSWCLDELLEILKCKQEKGQILMTVFYGADPSDVRKQTGDFGKVFKETCARKTKEESERWSQALNDVGNIAGEHFLNWDNESKMIEKIARDVSNKLNTTISWDFEDMVGIEAHLEKMQSLLHLEVEDEAMIVGISGPAGIGKTTIARALHSRLSSSFQLTCFMENLRGSGNNGLDEYGLKLRLQEQLLSKILNQNGMSVNHLRAIPERLCDQKVLIILDDVDDLQQLEALADETSWFGPGSRIIITTEDQELLEQHGIDNTYRVEFPTNEEARKIFRRYAFRRNLAPYGLERLVERVIEHCGNLPLGLRVMGSTLRGKKKDDWESLLHRLENSLDRKIDAVLRVGYDSLHENDQSLFLHIAFFFNNEKEDHVMDMLADSNLDVRLGLYTLAYKSLIQISTEGRVVMHKLLQQVGRQAVERQEPWKRQILTNAHEICDVLETESGSSSVTGMSLDISTIQNVVYISAGALKRMRNLQFLSIYNTRRRDTNVRVHVPEGMDFPPRLRLLRWEVYPGKCLPLTFTPEHLVELNLGKSKLEKLWQGTQLLTNLKKLKLTNSYNLKELPDLSNATNLERLELTHCRSLVEIPSSIGNHQKLEYLLLDFCSKLQVVPLSNLASLGTLWMWGCWQLRKFPDISTNVTELAISDRMLEEVLPESIRPCSRLEDLTIHGSAWGFPEEDFSDITGTADIERIPEWIKHLHVLKVLRIFFCPKLVSLPELPRSLWGLHVVECESLETIYLPFDSEFRYLSLPNCLKLGREARRAITQPSFCAYLPGREIPEEFNHRAIGNSLIIPSGFSRCRICAVVTPIQEIWEHFFILVCRISINGSSIEKHIFDQDLRKIRSEHLLIFPYEFLDEDGWALEHDKEILFEFSNPSQDVSITECGVQILMDETDKSRSSYGSYEDKDENLSDGGYESCSEQVFEDDDENLSHGRSYESCSEQMYEDDDENLSHEFDARRVNVL